MDWKETKILLQKYWEGETTLEEEMLLKEALKTDPVMIDPLDEQYFSAMDQMTQHSLSDSFDDKVLSIIQNESKGRMVDIKRFWSIAASIVVVLGIGLGIFLNQRTTQTNTEIAEAEEAFEFTKNALYLISMELNKGASVTQELDEFTEVLEKIKSENLN